MMDDASDAISSAAGDRGRLVVHVVYRLDIGGLETVLVNVINAMDSRRYRHHVVCLTTYTEFRHRIQQPGVGVDALDKQPGKDPGAYWRVCQAWHRTSGVEVPVPGIREAEG